MTAFMKIICILKILNFSENLGFWHVYCILQVFQICSNSFLQFCFHVSSEPSISCEFNPSHWYEIICGFLYNFVYHFATIDPLWSLLSLLYLFIIFFFKLSSHVLSCGSLHKPSIHLIHLIPLLMCPPCYWIIWLESCVSINDNHLIIWYISIWSQYLS